MEHYVGIDVSLKESSVCVGDNKGKIVRETKVASEPEALCRLVTEIGLPLTRIGLEAGPPSRWLREGLVDAGFQVVLPETRHVKAALSAMTVRHRTNRYLNNRLEQDHRGIKGRCRPMLGFKSTTSARRYCRCHDELRNFLRVRSRMCQHVPAASRRFCHVRRTAIALGILEAA